MEKTTDNKEVYTNLWDLFDKVELFFRNLITPWTFYQLLIILGCLGIAILLDRIIGPQLDARLRRLEGQPQLMRTLVIPLRRLKWIFWALLLWGVASVLKEFTWPSRSFFVQLAANLVGAWLAISIISRIFRNKDLARFLTGIAWPIAALAILGWLDDVINALDAFAITIGDLRVSALLIAKGIAVFAVLLSLASAAGSFIEQRLSRADDLTPTYQVLIAKLIKAILIVLAVVISLTAIGVDLTALAVFSGALGIGIGFGLQKVASNLISGIIILMDRSIKPGDVISLGETFGWIAKLQSRYVSVVTRDGVEHLIPNETFVTEPVVNWSYSNRSVRLEITFGASYNDDPHNVRKITVDAVSKIARVLSTPAPVCHVVGFGDSSVDYVLRFWIQDPEKGLTNLCGQAYLAVWDSFKENDITFPFPHREIRFSTPLHLQNQSDETS